MDDDDYGPYGTKLGKLSTGIMPYEDFMALARSFVSPTVFLDAVADFLKRLHTVFELKQISADGESTFFKKPNSGNVAASWRSFELDSVIKAWHLASKHNQEVASFNIETLEELKSVISRENEDILAAFCGANEELSKHRAIHELAERVSGKKGNKSMSVEVAVDLDPPPPLLAPDKVNTFIVPNLKSEEDKLKHVETVSGPSGQDNPLNGLNAGVEPTSDANWPTITKPSTPPVLFKSNRKGVSLRDAAIAVNDDAPELCLETKKRWQQDHRKHFLPTPIGKAENHSQMDLYDLNELCDAIAKLETHEQAELCRKRLKFKLKDIKEIVFKPSGPPASFGNKKKRKTSKP
ncbi:MAG: hypothetical protein O2856_06000 [Planctomycetota bacterium]|nr:hypothetical protein [Planctomycetota bacterium]